MFLACLWIRIRHYIKATWLLGCLTFLSDRLFVHKLKQVNNKGPVQVRDHSVYAPGQWEAILQCNTISHWSGPVHIQNVPCRSYLGGSLCGKNTGGFPTSPWWRHQMETFSALRAICAGNSPVNSPHKGQWRGALMFSLICARIKDWVNNGEAGDLRRHRVHYDVIVMTSWGYQGGRASTAGLC